MTLAHLTKYKKKWTAIRYLSKRSRMPGLSASANGLPFLKKGYESMRPLSGNSESFDAAYLEI